MPEQEASERQGRGVQGAATSGRTVGCPSSGPSADGAGPRPWGGGGDGGRRRRGRAHRAPVPRRVTRLLWHPPLVLALHPARGRATWPVRGRPTARSCAARPRCCSTPGARAGRRPRRTDRSRPAGRGRRRPRPIVSTVDLDAAVALVDLDAAVARVDIDGRRVDLARRRPRRSGRAGRHGGDRRPDQPRRLTARLDVLAVVARADFDAVDRPDRPGHGGGQARRGRGGGPRGLRRRHRPDRPGRGGGQARRGCGDGAGRLRCIIDRINLDTMAASSTWMPWWRAPTSTPSSRGSTSSGSSGRYWTSSTCPAIIRDSSGSMASETVRGVRMTSINADDALSRVVDRALFRRRHHNASDPPRSDRLGDLHGPSGGVALPGPTPRCLVTRSSRTHRCPWSSGVIHRRSLPRACHVDGSSSTRSASVWPQREIPGEPDHHAVHRDRVRCLGWWLFRPQLRRPRHGTARRGSSRSTAGRSGLCCKAAFYMFFPIGLFWCIVSPERRSVQDVAAVDPGGLRLGRPDLASEHRGGGAGPWRPAPRAGHRRPRRGPRAAPTAAAGAEEGPAEPRPRRALTSRMSRDTAADSMLARRDELAIAKSPTLYRAGPRALTRPPVACHPAAGTDPDRRPSRPATRVSRPAAH